MSTVWNSISRTEGIIKIPDCLSPGTTENCALGICVPCKPKVIPFGPSQDCSQPNSQPDYTDLVASKNCHKFRFLPQPCGSDWIEYCSGQCGVYPCWMKHPWLAFTDTLDGGMEYAVLPLALAGVAVGFYFLK